MRIVVRDRVPALPWEAGYWHPGLHVGLEASLTPEPGVLAFYRSIWPERYVVWDAIRQLWEVRQQNPVTGQDERVELLYRLAEAPDGYQVPAYAPFSFEHALRRARERSEFLHLGVERYLEQVDRRNDARSRSVIRGVAGDMAAGFKELRRYFPVLAGTGTKTPLVAVGINLKSAARNHRATVAAGRKGLIVCPS